ncbi:hypothetical protein KFZ76_16050 [Methylovulum psychrotolerans]|uniref:hypothetical protein n=1 Tax=Methylovulum psychrotolerans TaxID=1704499 RepID=UPI001BFF068F|nr:hypothetical protein [Methylovulum psychrotolerans]MBT9099207.1 hypothetical protein [Methylovulum psychrotolerans]
MIEYKLLQQLPHRQPPKPDRVGCSRPIRYPDSENAEGVAFADIEDAAVFGKQLRTAAWQSKQDGQ